MRILAKSNETEIILYDVIGQDFFGGVSAAEFQRELAQIEGDVMVRINSPGGSFFDGLTMHNLLEEHSGFVRASVDGLAASAASVVAMGADEIRMATGANMMIHEPWMVAEGNAADFRSAAERLDAVAGSIVDLYAKRTEQSHLAIREMMAAETWMDADQAIELGFADKSSGDAAIAACVDRNIFSYKMPDDLETTQPAKGGKAPIKRERLARLLKTQ